MTFLKKYRLAVGLSVFLMLTGIAATTGGLLVINTLGARGELPVYGALALSWIAIGIAITIIWRLMSRYGDCNSQNKRAN